jgi:hypothetical protein
MTYNIKSNLVINYKKFENKNWKKKLKILGYKKNIVL